MGRLGFLVLGLMLGMAFAGGARAQTNEVELSRINRDAMAAFSRLEVAEARATLEAAVEQARAAGLPKSAVARTLTNLGVVCVGGLGDNAAGLAAFTEALRIDSSVVIDPMFNAPDIQRVFDLAKRAASGAGAGASAGQGASTAPVTQPAYESTLLHVAPREQLTQTPVPIYVAGAELGAATMRISYRGFGMSQPKVEEMGRTQDGFAFMIPCKVVFQPKVEYWIEAMGEDGKVLGHAGTAAAPIVVPIVTQRTQEAPALPGKPAPAQCGADECPPGMPGCGPPLANHTQGLGDACRADVECQAGLSCRDDFCSVDDGRSRESNFAGERIRRVFVEAGFTLGAAYVGKGHPADGAPPRSVLEAARMRTPSEAQLAYIRSKGWSCDTTTRMVDTDGDGMPDDTAAELSDCDVAVSGPGFVPMLAVHLAGGYRITPKLYAAGTARIQLSRGKGTLAGVVLGARGGYVLVDPSIGGLGLDAFAGFGVGQIQAQPEDDSPFAISGMGAAELGVRGLYRITDRFSVVVTPHAFIMFPTFLFDIDLTAGMQVAF